MTNQRSLLKIKVMAIFGVIVLCVILFVIVTIIAIFTKDPKIEAVLARHCTGRPWREAFPAAEKQDIRTFLDVVVDAFALRRRDRLRLAPDLRIMKLYEACVYHQFGDNMELEELVSEVRYQYDIQLSEVWHSQITLGELFGIVHGVNENGMHYPVRTDE